MDQHSRGIVLKIAERAAALATANGNYSVKRLDVVLALTFVHDRAPLRLQELLDADDGNFGHDVFGVLHHIDPETTELRNCFVPRFTARDELGGE